MKLQHYRPKYNPKNFTSTPPSRKIAREVYKKLDTKILEYAHKEGITRSAILDILQNENLNKTQDTEFIEAISEKLLAKLKKLVLALNNNANHQTLKKEFKLTKVTTNCIYNQYAKAKRNNNIVEMYKECKDKEKVAQKYNVCVGTIDLITRCGNAFKDLLKQRESIIEEMLNNGKSSLEISKVIGISRSMVQRTARKLGKPLKHGGHRKKKLPEKLSQ